MMKRERFRVQSRLASMDIADATTMSRVAI